MSPTPAELWNQADSEHPGDDDARVKRYRELMVEHGYLIPGEPQPLACGWRWWKRH